MKSYVIKKIRKQADQLIVGIPKKSEFKAGEYVKVSKLTEEELD